MLVFFSSFLPNLCTNEVDMNEFARMCGKNRKSNASRHTHTHQLNMIENKWNQWEQEASHKKEKTYNRLWHAWMKGGKSVFKSKFRKEWTCLEKPSSIFPSKKKCFFFFFFEYNVRYTGQTKVIYTLYRCSVDVFCLLTCCTTSMFTTFYNNTVASARINRKKSMKMLQLFSYCIYWCVDSTHLIVRYKQFFFLTIHNGIENMSRFLLGYNEKCCWIFYVRARTHITTMMILFLFFSVYFSLSISLSFCISIMTILIHRLICIYLKYIYILVQKI